MNWLAAGLIALVMSTAYLLDGPSEHEARVDTVEEKIAELQTRKKELADAILQADNNLLSDLTADDLELLLS